MHNRSFNLHGLLRAISNHARNYRAGGVGI